MTQPTRFKPAVLAIASTILASCAGTGVPVRPYGYLDDQYQQRAEVLSNRDRAETLLYEWDKSLQYIQNANTATNTALPALAGLVGYRAARQKSAPATAGLAALGLVGMSITDAMVQLSRMNVYIEGISALECAVTEYDSVGLTSIRKTVDSKAILGSGDLDLIEAHKDFVVLYELVGAPLEAGLGHAMTRITRDTNRALLQSIVSVQSRQYGTTFSAPLQPKPAQPGLERLASRNAAPAIGPDPNELHIKRLLKAAELLEHDRSVAIAAAVAKMDTCVFGSTMTSSIEQRPVAMSLRAVNFEGKPVVLEKGAKAKIIVTGGTPDYAVALLPADATQLKADLAKAAGASIVELDAVNSAGTTQSFTVVVTDNANPKNTVIMDVQITP